MSVNVTFNGSTYTIPTSSEKNWGSQVTNYLVAISTGALTESKLTFEKRVDDTEGGVTILNTDCIVELDSIGNLSVSFPSPPANKKVFWIIDKCESRRTLNFFGEGFADPLYTEVISNKSIIAVQAVGGSYSILYNIRADVTDDIVDTSQRYVDAGLPDEDSFVTSDDVGNITYTAKAQYDDNITTVNAYIADSPSDAYSMLQRNTSGEIVKSKQNTAVFLPSGSNAQRPTAAAGMFRYNTESTYPEFYNGSAWLKAYEDPRFNTDSGSAYEILSRDATGSVRTSSSIDAVRAPAGTTAQRPAPLVGMYRFNTDLGRLEVYNGSVWDSLNTASLAGPLLTDLNDVNPTMVAAAGDSLVYDGAQWSNASPSVIIKPEIDAVGVGDKISIRTKPFLNYINQETHESTSWYLYDASDNSLIESAEDSVDKVIHVFNETLSTSDSVYIKVVFNGSEGYVSPTLTTSTYTKTADYINKPVFTSGNISESKSVVVEVGEFNSTVVETHESTNWYVLNDSGDILLTSLNDTENLNSFSFNIDDIGVVDGDTVYITCSFNGSVSGESCMAELDNIVIDIATGELQYSLAVSDIGSADVGRKPDINSVGALHVSNSEDAYVFANSLTTTYTGTTFTSTQITIFGPQSVVGHLKYSSTYYPAYASYGGSSGSMFPVYYTVSGSLNGYYISSAVSTIYTLLKERSGDSLLLGWSGTTEAYVATIYAPTSNSAKKLSRSVIGSLSTTIKLNTMSQVGTGSVTTVRSYIGGKVAYDGDSAGERYIAWAAQWLSYSSNLSTTKGLCFDGDSSRSVFTDNIEGVFVGTAGYSSNTHRRILLARLTELSSFSLKALFKPDIATEVDLTKDVGVYVVKDLDFIGTAFVLSTEDVLPDAYLYRLGRLGEVGTADRVWCVSLSEDVQHAVGVEINGVQVILAFYVVEVDSLWQIGFMVIDPIDGSLLFAKRSNYTSFTAEPTIKQIERVPDYTFPSTKYLSVVVTMGYDFMAVIAEPQQDPSWVDCTDEVEVLNVGFKDDTSIITTEMTSVSAPVSIGSVSFSTLSGASTSNITDLTVEELD